MTLGPEVIDFVGLSFLNNAGEITGIGEITIMQHQRPAFLVRVLVEVIDSIRIKRRRPPLNSVDLITLPQQKFRQIGAILASDSCD
jgi:hypothetical protein